MVYTYRVKHPHSDWQAVEERKPFVEFYPPFGLRAHYTTEIILLPIAKSWRRFGTTNKPPVLTSLELPFRFWWFVRSKRIAEIAKISWWCNFWCSIASSFFWYWWDLLIYKLFPWFQLVRTMICSCWGNSCWWVVNIRKWDASRCCSMRRFFLCDILYWTVSIWQPASHFEFPFQFGVGCNRICLPFSVDKRQLTAKSSFFSTDCETFFLELPILVVLAHHSVAKLAREHEIR